MEKRAELIKTVNLKKLKKVFIFVFAILMIFGVAWLLYAFNVIPHRQYINADFGIETYKSLVDKDGDGIDDQTDFFAEREKIYRNKTKI